MHPVCMCMTCKAVKIIKYHKVKLAKNSKMVSAAWEQIYGNIFTGDPVIEKGFISENQERPRGFKENRIDMSLLKRLA